MERSFKVNSGTVVFENYDSESLAINLDTGTYYSLAGPASRLWTMLTRSTPSARIAEYFAAAHEGDPKQIADAVHRFLERLESEQLIVEDTGADATDRAGQETPPAERTPFEDFDMRVFTDMQDLLMLDPIHDADEAGWPSARG